MIDLENDLFTPVFNFLTEKREYFRKFGEIAKNKELFTEFHQKKPQNKNEEWFRAELSVFLMRNEWLVAIEVDKKEIKKIDLCIQKNNQEICIEIKEYINSGKTPTKMQTGLK